MRLSSTCLCACLLLGVSTGLASAQPPDADVRVQMAEATRRFDALDYEQALPRLDRVVEALQSREDVEARRLLTQALEMRARARFGLSDPDGARQDFAALLRLEPSHTLGNQISPRVVDVFAETKKATVTTAHLAVTPPDAVVLLDGVQVDPSGDVQVVIGAHTVTASRMGYKTASSEIRALADTVTPVTMALVRTSAVLSIVTAPSDVEVIIDGVSHGRTMAGPLPAEFAAAAASSGISPTDSSGILSVADLQAGSHRIEFRRDCYQAVERRQEIAGLDDVRLAPVKLAPANATLSVDAPSADTAVFVDGDAHGNAPYSAVLCEGTHVIEMRGPTGRDRRRVELRAGQPTEIHAALRPAFVVVSSTQTSLNADLRSAIERAFEPLRSILVFAPTADGLGTALGAERLPPDWLAYDGNRRPVGVSAEVTAAMRRDLSARLARAFDAQGIAAVTAPVASNRSHLVLTLLGAGMSEPDVIEVDLEQPATVASAIARLDQTRIFATQTIGVSIADVADLDGPVVVAVDETRPAGADVQVGDIIVSVDGAATADGATLSKVIMSHSAGDTVRLQLKGRDREVRNTEVMVQTRPRVLGIDDQTIFVNPTLVRLRARLAEATSPEQRASIRLNLAAALTRLESWNEARTELLQISLTEGPGVGPGTVQYLLGICEGRLGHRAEAEQAFKAAAATDNLLTEDGPAVKELAVARLAELGRTPTP